MAITSYHVNKIGIHRNTSKLRVSLRLWRECFAMQRFVRSFNIFAEKREKEKMNRLILSSERIYILHDL